MQVAQFENKIEVFNLLEFSPLIDYGQCHLT